ncbi:Uncharacterised protein [Bartonella vinsonii]|uniref:Uncharacterized protein n=1 Tax=Bartonella vinsonii TaxID=33047 RepID=A0A448V4M6_BARVI|nr:Uncharacterised protein [Bartonella vinsonii]
MGMAVCYLLLFPSIRSVIYTEYEYIVLRVVSECQGWYL